MTYFQKTVNNLAIKLGYPGLSALINNHITAGGNFQSFKKFLEIHNIWYSEAHVWKDLRSFLTIPYDNKDAFKYRWDKRAREKGFRDAQHMFSTFREKGLVPWEVAQRLDMSTHHIKDIIAIFGNYKRPQRKRKRTHLGFFEQSSQERWNQRAQSLGYKNIKNCIRSMRKKRRSFRWIAQKFGVSPPTASRLVQRIEEGKKYERKDK